MDGFIIETVRKDAHAPGGWSIRHWIGIASSARDLLVLVHDPTARVVDSGPEVFARARAFGVRDGEVQLLP